MNEQGQLPEQSGPHATQRETGIRSPHAHQGHYRKNFIPASRPQTRICHPNAKCRPTFDCCRRTRAGGDAIINCIPAYVCRSNAYFRGNRFLATQVDEHEDVQLHPLLSRCGTREPLTRRCSRRITLAFLPFAFRVQFMCNGPIRAGKRARG